MDVANSDYVGGCVPYMVKSELSTYYAINYLKKYKNFD